jgi:hypothetical protein
LCELALSETIHPVKKIIDPKILSAAKKVSGKRAKAVIDFIIENEIVTTTDLEKMGYIHPPRAVRDVRENGIPIETLRVKDSNGKSIAAYRFGDASLIQDFKLGGRKIFPKNLKTELYSKQSGKCAICGESYDSTFFQIDHRVPYEFMGDGKDDLAIDDFMLLCASCNRKKARATETVCANTCYKSNNIEIIKSCFWASPESYTHIGMEKIRIEELVWKGDLEVGQHDKLVQMAHDTNKSIQTLIKEAVSNLF